MGCPDVFDGHRIKERPGCTPPLRFIPGFARCLPVKSLTIKYDLHGPPPLRIRDCAAEDATETPLNTANTSATSPFNSCASAQLLFLSGTGHDRIRLSGLRKRPTPTKHKADFSGVRGCRSHSAGLECVVAGSSPPGSGQSRRKEAAGHGVAAEQTAAKGTLPHAA